MGPCPQNSEARGVGKRYVSRTAHRSEAPSPAPNLALGLALSKMELAYLDAECPFRAPHPDQERLGSHRLFVACMQQSRRIF